MKRILIFVGLCLGASLLLLVFGFGDSTEFTKAKRTELKLGVEVTGRLQAVRSSAVGAPRIPGVYRFKISMMAPEGKEVHKGDPVLAFDTSELTQRRQERSAAVESARKEIEKKEIDNVMGRQDDNLALEEARAQLRKAKLKADRPAAISKGLDAKQASLDLELAQTELRDLKRRVVASRRAAQAELASLETRLQRAEAEFQQTQEAIGRMTCLAPRDGIVTYISNWRDEKNKVGDSVWRDAKVLEIPDLSIMKASGEVEEALAGHIRQQQPVSFHLDAYPDLEYMGKIASISASVQEKSWRNPRKVIKVQIELDRTDPEKMRPGMRFRGSIETQCLKDVLTIPIDAVFLSPKGPVVYRKSLLHLKSVPVTLGPRNQERVAIVDGLHEGDLISRTRPNS